MAGYTWPPDLPQRPLRDSWNRTAQDSRWTFEPDAGPAYSRRAGRKGDKMTMVFAMTKEQTAAFRDFFNEVLHDGTLCFSYPDPETGADMTVRFTTGQDPYSIRARGIEREVTCNWEVMPS